MLLKFRCNGGEGVVRWGYLWLGSLFVLSLMSSSAIVAQGVKRPPENIKSTREGRGVSDIRDARDHPLVKRFPGSSIVRYEKEDSGNYTLPTGPIVRWDYTNDQPDFAGKKLDLEGQVTRITYLVRPGSSSAEVFASLKNDLMTKGFKSYYEAQGPAFGRAQGNLYKNLREQLFEYNPKGARFLSAKYVSRSSYFEGLAVAIIEGSYSVARLSRAMLTGSEWRFRFRYPLAVGHGGSGRVCSGAVGRMEPDVRGGARPHRGTTIIAWRAHSPSSPSRRKAALPLPGVGA